MYQNCKNSGAGLLRQSTQSPFGCGTRGPGKVPTHVLLVAGIRRLKLLGSPLRKFHCSAFPVLNVRSRVGLGVWYVGYGALVFG